METKELKTENRLATMEQKIDNLIQSVDKVGKNVDKVDAKLDKHVEWEAEKYEKLDSKYSGKWVEKAIISIGTAIIITIIGGIITFVMKN